MRRVPRFILAFLLSAGAIHAGEGGSTFGDYDEVIRDLVPNLAKDRVSAQDAAIKLARLGKRTVSILAEIMNANIRAREPKGEAAKDPRQNAAYLQSRQLTYYSVLSLSRIKHAEAGKILLPLLKDAKALPELRALTLEALGLELVDDAGEVLQHVAANDPDPHFRKKALLQLSIMPSFWVQSEKLFVEALSSPDDDVRLLAAKQCYFARIYTTAADRLIEIAVKDSNSDVRMQAMLALGRMRPQRAVPPLVKMLAEDTSLNDRDKLQILRTVNAVTGIQFKDVNGIDAWWKRQGEKEYARLIEAETQATPVPASQNTARVAPRGEGAPKLKALPAEATTNPFQGLSLPASEPNPEPASKR
jgi:HEAT repeat protein